MCRCSSGVMGNTFFFLVYHKFFFFIPLNQGSPKLFISHRAKMKKHWLRTKCSSYDNKYTLITSTIVENVLFVILTVFSVMH